MDSANWLCGDGEPVTAADLGTDAFEVFYELEYAPMVRLAAGLIDSHERAQEIVQDAFERILLRWDRLNRPGAYLRVSVVNRCRSELRRRTRWRKRPYPASGAAEAGRDPDEYLLDALARLSPRRRLAVTLRYYGDLSEAEIAEAMGIRPGTVKSLVSRGLADLRKAIEP